MNEIFGIQPYLRGLTDCEPCLSYIIAEYYGHHFPRAEAAKLTMEYIHEVERLTGMKSIQPKGDKE